MSERDDAPERIYLQGVGGPDPVTWCRHPVGPEDVEYVRADRPAPSDEIARLRAPKPTERDVVVKHEWDQRLADVAGRMKSYGYDAETLRVLVDHILGGAEVPMPTERETGEVERLRAALEEIASYTPAEDNAHNGTYDCGICIAVIGIARRALTEGGET